MEKNLIIIGHEPAVSAGSIIEYLKNGNINFQYIDAAGAETFPDLKLFQYFIVLGGTLNTCDVDKFPWLVEEKHFLKKCILSGKRGLGICLGGQLLAEALGAKVYKNEFDEIGWFLLQFPSDNLGHSPLKVISASDYLLQSHRYTFEHPKNSIRLAWSAVTRNQAFLFDNRILGLQFHPEVTVSSVEQFYDMHREEQEIGPFIQNRTDILDKELYFQRSKTVMFSILDWLFEKV